MFYTVISIFRTSSDASDYQPLYSEEITAIKAESEEEAKEKAISQGKSSERSYKNQYDETISVHFETVVDVQKPIDEEAFSAEGTIYVRHFRDYDAYEAFEPLLKGQAL